MFVLLTLDPFGMLTLLGTGSVTRRIESLTTYAEWDI